MNIFCDWMIGMYYCGAVRYVADIRIGVHYCDKNTAVSFILKTSSVTGT